MQVSRILAGRFVIFFVGNSSLKGKAPIIFSTHNCSSYLFILACIVSNSKTIKVTDSTITSILQMKKWRLREVKSITTETTNIRPAQNLECALGGAGVSDFIFTPRGFHQTYTSSSRNPGEPRRGTGGGWESKRSYIFVF